MLTENKNKNSGFRVHRRSGAGKPGTTKVLGRLIVAGFLLLSICQPIWAETIYNGGDSTNQDIA